MFPVFGVIRAVCYTDVFTRIVECAPIGRIRDILRHNAADRSYRIIIGKFQRDPCIILCCIGRLTICDADFTVYTVCRCPRIAIEPDIILSI